MTLKACTILAIDDSRAILTFLRISLELYGMTFHAASTAAEGARLYRDIRPDIIILDLGLPDHSGLDLLPELCQPDSTRDVPAAVIVLTVRQDAATRLKALKLGASSYLTKPFLMEELLEIIAAHVHCTAIEK
jgi:DNA-binding response OmpR family regulator